MRLLPEEVLVKYFFLTFQLQIKNSGLFKYYYYSLFNETGGVIKIAEATYIGVYE